MHVYQLRSFSGVRMEYELISLSFTLNDVFRLIAVGNEFLSCADVAQTSRLVSEAAASASASASASTSGATVTSPTASSAVSEYLRDAIRQQSLLYFKAYHRFLFLILRYLLVCDGFAFLRSLLSIYFS